MPVEIKRAVEEAGRPGEVTFSQAEDPLFRERTRKRADGSLHVEVVREYLDLVRDMRRQSRAFPVSFMPEEAGLSRHVALAHVTSVLVESPTRSNFFWTMGNQSGMLTVWDFRADGASIVTIQSFINAQVGSSTATIALATHPAEPARGMWKVTWSREGIQFELYVEEQLAEAGVAQKRAGGNSRIGSKADLRSVSDTGGVCGQQSLPVQCVRRPHPAYSLLLPHPRCLHHRRQPLHPVRTKERQVRRRDGAIRGLAGADPAGGGGVRAVERTAMGIDT